jgi:hypothetical protein
MHPMTQKKEQLKDMAKAIHTLKQNRKPECENYHMSINYEIYSAGRKYRIQHIAYCLVRGRTYEQIEQPKECNRLMEYEWKTINKIHDELKLKVDAATAEYLERKYSKEASNG